MNFDLASLPVLPIPALPQPAAISGTPPQSAAAAPSTLNPQPSTFPISPSRTLPDTPFELPNRARLLFGLKIDAIMHQLFAGEQFFLGCPTQPFEVYSFLWMCAHPPAPGQLPVWEQMDWVETGEGTAYLPLYLRPYDLFRTAVDWFEAEFQAGRLPMDFPGYAILASALWNHHKAAEVVLDPNATTGTLPEKKKKGAATRTRLTSLSTSSPAATPSSGKTSSTASRSATPSPRATAASLSKGLPSSPRQNSKSGGKTRRGGSRK